MRRFLLSAAIAASTVLFTAYSIDDVAAKGRGGGPRPSYGGGKHSSSHGGHYSGGRGSSHKGGAYKNARSANRYGTHK